MTENILVIFAAFVLDRFLGDPGWIPHPVRGIGSSASFFESFFRRKIHKKKMAGIAAALAVLLTGIIPVIFVLFLSDIAGRSWKIIFSVIVVYFSIASRDLEDHAMRVKKALDAGDADLARKHVSFMVGRDTDKMNEPEISRAVIESVGENTVDAVLSPLFWAFVFGPAGAFGYRIINTLDSMFGHKNERYLEFGWFPARLDDFANYIPARAGIPCFAIASWLCGFDGIRSFKTVLRDGQKHPSPNSGISEAAMAGALGIQLGGRVFRKGYAHDNPLIGDPLKPLDKDRIKPACRLMTVVSGVFILSGVVLCMLFSSIA